MVADIFDEVADDLRADRMKALARRWGPAAAGALVLLVLAIGGWQAWRWQQDHAAQGVASQFIDAMRAADSAAGQGTPARQQATEAFTRLAADAPEGYATLARLRAAGLKADAGDQAGALALWDQVSKDNGAEQRLRDLASLLWVQHQIDAGDPAALDARLQPLLATSSPWRPLAQESQAWLALRTGQTDKAKDTLRRLAADVSVPDGVRGRASGLLAQLGEPPAAAPAGPGPAASVPPGLGG